jgi:hypothetical protein
MIRAMFITKADGVFEEGFSSLEQVSNRAIALGSNLLFHRVLKADARSRRKKEKKEFRSFEI